MHPFIHIFGINIPSYGLMMATALVFALIFCYIRTKKAGLDQDIFANLAIISIVAGIVGAYLLYIFVTYKFSEIWESIRSGSFTVFKQGGLVFYGAIIAGFLGAFIYLRAKKQRFLDYAAILVVSVPLAHGIGRIGCFLAGCCYGKCVDTPISVIYTNPVGGAPTGVPVFPIQLVETACLIIFFIIMLLYTRKNIKRHSALFFYMILYGIERFILEYFRYDEIRGIFLGLSTSQWISIAMVILGIIGMIVTIRNKGDEPELAPAEGDASEDKAEDEANNEAEAEVKSADESAEASADAEAKPEEEASGKSED